eukprot:8844253-Alexandrium_andersonii.AAC.1
MQLRRPGPVGNDVEVGLGLARAGEVGHEALHVHDGACLAQAARVGVPRRPVGAVDTAAMAAQ